MRQKAGRIVAGGLTKDITFEFVDGPVNDRIDDGYRAKCGESTYHSPMISVSARAATVKVTRRE
jgi:hypothetical protein